MNQYIYLKGKLAGPVEMEEPTKPDPLAYSQMHRAEYSRDLYHYEENLKIYREHLASLPSIEVHESLKSKLVEGKKYEKETDFITKCFWNRNTDRNIPTLADLDDIAFPVPDPAPQPERLFTLQEVQKAFKEGYSSRVKKMEYKDAFKQYFSKT